MEQAQPLTFYRYRAHTGNHVQETESGNAFGTLVALGERHECVRSEEGAMARAPETTFVCAYPRSPVMENSATL